MEIKEITQVICFKCTKLFDIDADIVDSLFMDNYINTDRGLMVPSYIFHCPNCRKEKEQYGNMGRV